MPSAASSDIFVGIQYISLATNVDRRSDLVFVALAGALAALFDGNLAYAAGVTLAFAILPTTRGTMIRRKGWSGCSATGCES